MVKFSSDLFVQLGGQLWQTRPAEFWPQSNTALRAQHAAPERAVAAQIASETASQTAMLENQVSSAQPLISAPVSGAQPSHPACLVLIGSELNAIWENDDALEWPLWLNICRAFGWPEEQVSYFDTDVLSSDEAVFTTLEEILALDVSQVVSMVPEHALAEQLAEGLLVLTVPSLGEMLADPYAKHRFYETLMRASE